jgi:hypothetical protein
MPADLKSPNTNYFKLCVGKYYEILFFAPKTLGQQYRRALARQGEMRRQGSPPTLSIYHHPRVRGVPLVPLTVPCVGGCHECQPEVPGVDPDDVAGN